MLPIELKNSYLVGQTAITYLTEEQVNALTIAFQNWYDKSTGIYHKKRGNYWLVFLVLRFTGARISEVINAKYGDIDFRNAEMRLITLKRHNPKKRNQTRIVPVPPQVTSEIATFLAQYPDIKDRLFLIDRSNFYRVFQERCQEAGIPKELSHPHILRHTRAIELLRTGVPVTIVQDLLGHSALTTTAVYLRISGQEAKNILREKGLV
ncbi:tyrosine-type recombinase/integrase [Hippea alviniae]|uniref:tyrosine-type recombinase/integrase n=1 Tax=Hippea alviniae TaxID=1279027 RepID=UPI0003B31FC3|nr:site-specific integrase [Hippea alviniae]